MQLKTRVLIFAGAAFLFLGGALTFHFLSLGNLRIIACDVGQGDGLLIITPDGKQIVVDGGPGDKMAGCLSSYMPFWDRSIDMVLNTHPQQDHLEGLVGVLANYKVKMIATTGVVNMTELYREWEKAIKVEGAKIYIPKAGDRVVFDSKQARLPARQGSTLSMDILWPGADKIVEWAANPPKDSNESSIVFRLNYGGFCAYFTGDIPKEILEDVIDKKCQVLKVAHHGSKTGTSEKIVEEVSPEIAIVQVGKNNRFGHPTKEVLDMLVSKGVKTVRNDTNGVIEIESEGREYRVKVENGRL